MFSLRRWQAGNCSREGCGHGCREGSFATTKATVNCDPHGTRVLKGTLTSALREVSGNPNPTQRPTSTLVFLFVLLQCHSSVGASPFAYLVSKSGASPPLPAPLRPSQATTSRPNRSSSRVTSLLQPLPCHSVRPILCAFAHKFSSDAPIFRVVNAFLEQSPNCGSCFASPVKKSWTGTALFTPRGLYR